MNDRLVTKGSKGKSPVAAGLMIALGVLGAPGAMPTAHAQSAAAPMPAAPMPVASMQRVAGDAGWAASEKQLMWTTDGGRRWTDITPPGLGSQRLERLFFLDASRGWAATVSATGRDAVVWRTADGGATWTSRPLASLADGGIAIAIEFADRDHGWVMIRLPSSANFSRGALFATADGGQTWKELPAPPIGGAVRFASPTTGWLAGGPGGDQLHITRDGGATWKRQSVAPPAAVEKGSQPVYQLPVVSGARAALTVRWSGPTRSLVATYQTADTGATWALREALPLAGRADLDSGVVAAAAAAGTIAVDNRVPELVSSRRGDPTGAAISASLFDALALDESVVAMDIDGAGRGWLALARGVCLDGKSRCRQEGRLVSTADLGRTLTDITPRVVPAGDVHIDTVTLNTGRGFDKCAVGTVSQMQAWWTDTPWSFANIYIGGGNRACGQAGLTASWVTSVFNQGWRLIPTWVGLQAPGSSCTGCSKMSTNTTTARQQGINEANAAADVATALGLRAPSIIYYDMERYEPTSHPAVKAFINAWVERLRQRGYQAGVYGAGINAASDWDPIANPPQAVWIANWNGNQSVFNLTGLPNTLWANHQRVHQYQGPHNETWGGVTFNIDSNRADGPLADN